MKATTLFLFVFLISACGNKQKSQTLQEQTPDELVEQAKQKVIIEDTTIYDMPYNTAYLDDAINYFRKNNKYKDWDKNDKKKILVRAIIEKDSTASNIQVLSRDSANLELKEEAIRLIREAKILPALNENGEVVRSKWVNIIEFPPR